MPRSKHVLAPVLAALAAVGLFATALPALAALQEGVDYRALQPQPPEPSSAGPGKIEVVEFFSYACPHCNEFYPKLNAWLARQQKDVVLRRVPVGFERPPWVSLERAYYALQATGDLEKLDGALFHAIHEQNQPLFDEKALADWVGKNGGSAENFATAYASFGVNNQTLQADQMAMDYEVDAVPTLVVAGKYVPLGSDHAEILKNADGLIVKVRAERAAAKRAPKAK
jgi:thiol:disulfide interchange protein DsbA